jgi:Uma2 family endonuclease
MNQEIRPGPPPAGPSEEEDPYRYGWRYLRKKLPDGTETVDIVPLSYEDLLYPEEDDFVVQKPPHFTDTIYCHYSLKAFYADQPSVVVLSDCRVDWGVAGVRPLGPDVLVLFAVREWRQQGTFRIAEEGGEPVLVMEIASPSTRDHDWERKPDLYYRAGVQKYVILDRGPDGEDPAQLSGFQRGATGWVPLPPDAQGRLDLAPVGLLLGIEDDRPWLYNAATGERLPDHTEALQALAETKQKRMDAEATLQQEAQARADAEAKLQQEAQARADAESKTRDAEAKLQQETKARADAESKARQEAQARADAESKARDAESKTGDAEAKLQQEAQARADLEKRLRALEDQLRRPQDQRGENPTPP